MDKHRFSLIGGIALVYSNMIIDSCLGNPHLNNNKVVGPLDNIKLCILDICRFLFPMDKGFLTLEKHFNSYVLEAMRM